MNERFIKKYMRLAKQFGEDDNPCHSRKIGTIIVHPEENRIVASGYNGPPRGIPHCDSSAHLEMMWSQLSVEDKLTIVNHFFDDEYKFYKYDCKEENHYVVYVPLADIRAINNTMVKLNTILSYYHESYVDNIRQESCIVFKDKNLNNLISYAYGGCQQCPRRILSVPSGERSELCSCSHSEYNAIARATESLRGCILFAWCGVACWDCAKAIVNAQIKKCYFIDWGNDYSVGSRWLLENGNIEFEVRPKESYLDSTT